MRLSWIIVVSGLCTTSFTYETQQVMGGPELGATPSFACTDPLADKPNCSCTCTNGITFDQPLSLDSQNCPGTPAYDCQVEKDECARQEQVLKDEITKKTQEYNECKTELSKCVPAQIRSRYRYKGCFQVTPGSLFLPGTRSSSDVMTVELCAVHCQAHRHFATTNANVCFCGDKVVGTAPEVKHSDCNSPCIGDKTEMCGALWKFSLYTKVA
ncbi:hypothetical protein PSV08DRAFT_409781 [Bipolaris maydis]|nr:hypothetical protein PSV08DRAFT_409781 [Bipolaris maydis]KAJ6278080.1 hypothetical protein J3E71DRAFT_394083 [Bipolaris maydis]